MALHEPRGDETEEEELERLGLKCDKRVIETATWPFAPFLRITLLKEGEKNSL